MTTYRFVDERTEEEFDEFMSISAKDGYLKDNPHFKQVYTPFAIAGDHLMGVGPKVDGGFTENMQRIAAAHPNSPMADKYGGNKSHARIKSEQIAKKHKLLGS